VKLAVNFSGSHTQTIGEVNFPAEGESGCTPSRKSSKSSKYFGVSWHKGMHKWAAKIYYDGKRHPLGYFEDEAEVSESVRQSCKEGEVEVFRWRSQQ
jgi:hypothetical protein